MTITQAVALLEASITDTHILIALISGNVLLLLFMVKGWKWVNKVS